MKVGIIKYVRTLLLSCMLMGLMEAGTGIQGASVFQTPVTSPSQAPVPSTIPAPLSPGSTAPATPPSAPSTYEALSEDAEINFYQLLQQGIKKSQDQYTQLKNKVDGQNASDKDRQALMNAATALEVKYTLYKNFYNTPSIRSPLVRAQLEKLFKKDFISLDDLTQLKKTVAQEKTKVSPSASGAQ